MAEVDRLMTDAYRIGLPLMMENAGAALAMLVERSLQRRPGPASVVVLAGTGGNGGGALVAARRLAAWGRDVRVILADRNLSRTPMMQKRILVRMGVAVNSSTGEEDAWVASELARATVVIDGLIGYSLQGAPRGEVARLIGLTAKAGGRIVSLDLPSGLDPSSGVPANPTVRAAATLTLALPKRGLLLPMARPYVGRLYLADIGVPLQAYALLGIDVPELFAKAPLIRIARGRRSRPASPSA